MNAVEVVVNYHIIGLFNVLLLCLCLVFKQRERERQPWLVWLSWLEHCPIHKKVGGLISHQGICLGCRLDPMVGVHGGGS